MSVSPEEVARRLQADAQASERRARVRADALREHLHAARDRLRGAGARSVWLFGSLADGSSSPDSDVDLAVEGLDPACYFDVLADLMALFGTRVDLVRLEQAPPSLIERILASGSVLA